MLFLYYTFLFPDPLSMRPKTTGPLLRIIGYDGSTMAERAAPRAPMCRSTCCPRTCRPAVVAIEETARFYLIHPGLDVSRPIARAALDQLKAGRFEARRLHDHAAAGQEPVSSHQDRTFAARKAEKKSVLALWLELRLSKPEILELYLNRGVYFGGGAHGIEAAAKTLFCQIRSRAGTSPKLRWSRGF